MRKILAVAFIATVFQGCISVTPYSAIDIEKTDLCHNPIMLEVCAGKSTAYVGESNLVLEPDDCYTIPYYKLSEITTSTKPLKVSGEATVRIARNKER